MAEYEAAAEAGQMAACRLKETEMEFVIAILMMLVGGQITTTEVASPFAVFMATVGGAVTQLFASLSSLTG